ncbi:efflux RND transporter permease subunit [Sulfurimonas sp.]|uniref:efflux RND transporter permease subunit n=1 Tax=Sulfurimonas sp. TaxID=2022749 RepID=UPI002AB04EC8|nr:efflux RND transporter permease subunit [Sulfurimonas sp.]
MEELIYGIIGSKAKRRKVILYIVLAFLLSVMLIPTKLVLAKMLPGKSANTFSIYVDTATNSSIGETSSVTNCVLSYLKKEEAVKNIEIYLAQGAPLDYAGLVKGSALKRMKNQAEMVINLSDKHSRDETSYKMVHRIRPLIQKTCGTLVNSTSIKFVEMPSGPPTFATLEINIFGKDDELMRRTANRVAMILGQTDGLVDIDVMQDDIYPYFEIIPDKEKVIKSGLSVDQVNNILYIAFEGMVVAVKNSKKQQDQIPIFVRLDDKSREIMSNSKSAIYFKLSRLKLLNQKGMMIPIREVISVNEIPSSPTIFRKNLQNFVSISAECDLVSQLYPLLEARDTIIEKLSDDFNVTKVEGMSTYMFDLNLVEKNSGKKMLLRWDGEMKVSLDTFRDLGGAFIAALVLMFLLMVMYYKSFALSGIILLASFLSIIGVITGHFITDIISLFFADINFFLTATSLIGFISLMGISARSSLLLIDFSMALIKKGVEKRRAIAIATATRAKPIVMTAVAIILGSLLLSTDPIFGGLGVALIFGSIASTVVSLFLVPVLIVNTVAICPEGMDHKHHECHGGIAEHVDPEEIGL